jgi:uncharacterized membrane protein YphA (DoxX/SURF4 family)
MKTAHKSFEGKSLIFNVLFILLNLLGLTFLAIGYHDSFSETGGVYLILGYLFFISGLVLIGIFSGWMMFSYFSRILVGGLFIVSGLIKANDPKGFSYKLEEYFEDGALAYRVKELLGWETFSLEFLIEYALLLSILICVFEIVLGVLAIIGGKIKSTTWLMLLMMVFFTLLTWHTKNCDPNVTFRDVDVYALDSDIAQLKINEATINDDVEIIKQDAKTVRVSEVKKPQCVDDCGCFGDAMKGSIGRSLTPQESFWKDIVLLYLVLIIFISRRYIKPNSTKENIIMLSSAFLFIAFFSWIFSWWFPLIFGLFALTLSLWIKRAGGKYLGNDWGAILIVTFMSFGMVWYVLAYRPIKDYRPYHVGSNLIERMNDGIDGEYENVFIYHNNKTGEDKTFSQDEFNASKIWEDKVTWEWKETVTKTIIASKLPSITDQFNPKLEISEMTATERNMSFVSEFMEENKVEYIDIIDKNSGNRYPQLLEDFWLEDWDTSQYVIGDTIQKMNEQISEISILNYILKSETIILVISRDIKAGDFSRIYRLKEISDHANEQGIPMIMISTADKEDVIAFREKYELDIPTFINDETELKAITRSNPTLMVLSNGVVKAKFAYRSTPSLKWLIENVLSKI